MATVPPQPPAAAPPIALRFQRSLLQDRADLSPAGLAALAQAAHPARFVEGLAERGQTGDAVHALALMLPSRQAVWWACLAARLLPGLDAAGEKAIAAAERWVQSAAPGDAEQAGDIAQAGDLGRAPAWAAMAAFWSGPSIAPRGQQAVPPAGHLTGAAVRSALILLTYDPAFGGKVSFGDWLEIGFALMNGGNGREAQAGVRDRLALG